ncbi:ABC transporter substrate-binding protein [Microbispora bryophytorum]|uniref:ABC transporter substrate-binding protein n=1 Tax=Microbispora bryophytorum TaxID=1460882 RepID=UPI0033EE145E
MSRKNSPAHFRKLRGTGLAALATAGLMLVTACSGSSNGGSADGPVTLRMTIWSGNAEHLKLLNSIAADYRKTHPEVQSIKFDVLPSDNYITTLTTQIAGGKAPDLAWIQQDSASDFVASGALAPINDDSDVLPSAKKLWQKDGKLYAYPFSTSPFGVFVNTDLLKKADQPTPEELIKQGKWTWDEVARIGSAVNAKTGKAGMVIRDFEYKQWPLLVTVWDGWGAQPWSADGKTCTFDQPAMTGAMTYLHDAIFKDKALPVPGTTADFFAGDAAMTVTQISRSSLLSDKFTWDFVPLPAGVNGSYGVIGQAGLGVLARGKHVKEATDFLTFLSDKENSAKLGRYFPQARTSQLTVGTLTASNPQLTPKQLDVVIDGIENGQISPSHTNTAEIVEAVRSALDPLWKTDANVQQVLKGVCTALKPQLEK